MNARFGTDSTLHGNAVTKTLGVCTLQVAAIALLAACAGSSPTSDTDADVTATPPHGSASSGGQGGDDGPGPGGSGGANTGDQRPTYLALGDSIAFGYDINHKQYFADGTSVDLPDQAAIAIGYPEALVKTLGPDGSVRVANTACPGEASGSLVSGKHVDDNNCYENRHIYSLHYEYDHDDYDFRDGTEENEENYGSGVSQLDHALAYLGDDPNRVKLITITMGANDVGRFAGGACNWVQSLWDAGCLIGGSIDAVFNKVQQSWETTLNALVDSGYTGPIVVVLYYSPGYRLIDLPMRAGIKLLNDKIRDKGKEFLAKYPTLNLKFVESYEVFQSLSSNYGDDPCKAGLTMLVTQGPDTGKCDVHASHFGEEQLATEVWKSLTFEEQQAVLEGP